MSSKCEQHFVKYVNLPVRQRAGGKAHLRLPDAINPGEARITISHHQASSSVIKQLVLTQNVTLQTLGIGKVPSVV